MGDGPLASAPVPGCDAPLVRGANDVAPASLSRTEARWIRSGSDASEVKAVRTRAAEWLADKAKAHALIGGAV